MLLSQLFTGITSFLLCAMFIAMYLLGKAADRSFLIIEFVITAIYWVFWLAAAAATADTVHWVNDWYSGYDKADCNALKNLGYNTWCGGNVDALRACCAFCWLTWALFTVSLFFNIYHDIMQKKVFSKGAAPAGTTTAAPGSVPTSTVVKPVDGSDTV